MRDVALVRNPKVTAKKEIVIGMGVCCSLNRNEVARRNESPISRNLKHDILYSIF